MPRIAMSGVLAATALIASMVASDVRAEAVEEFYRGKTITVVIPIGPGGTYDFYGRLGGKIMEKFLPGKPTVVAQLMTGAGGAKASNYIGTVAPKDGTYLVSLHASAAQNQVLKVTGVRYDVSKFLMVGQFAQINSSLTVLNTAPAKTLKEAMQKEVILGSTGKGSYQYQLPFLLNKLAGTKFKIVIGYNSVSEENLAMERGEIHGRGGTVESWAITKPEWVRENRLAHLVQVGAKRAKGFESVPLATEFVTDPEAKQMITLVSSGSLLGRSIASTPGVPADRAKALRDAFDKGIKDPEILAQAEKQKLYLDPASGAELEAIVKEIVATPPSVVDKVKQILEIKS